jgi:dienelactone hydrolase
MMKKIVLLLFSALLTVSTGFAQQKKPLDHSVYDHWKDLVHPAISDDGAYISFEINPQQGDGWLYVYDVKRQKADSMARGHSARFIPDEAVMVFAVKPQFQKVMHLKRKKVKKDKLPADSLAVLSLKSGSVKRFGQIREVQVPQKPSGKWIAALMKKSSAKQKTVSGNEKPKKTEKKRKKEKGSPLMLYNVISGDSVVFRNVTRFSLSKNGMACVFTGVQPDTVARAFVAVFFTKTGETDTLFSDRGYVKNVTVDEAGIQAAYTFSNDTAKNKAYGLYYADLKNNKQTLVSGKDFQNLPKGWSVSPYGKIFFNKSGTELCFGTSPKPLPPLKDTLAPSEKVSLDIWTYHDTLLQPQQKLHVNRDKHRSYTAVYFPETDKTVQLGSPSLKEIQIKPSVKGKYSLGFDERPYLKMTSWIGQWYSDVYLVNRQTGQRSLIIPKVAYGVSLSPGQRFVSWYNLQDSAWYAYNIKTRTSICITGAIKFPLYNVLNDVPNMAPPYGMAGWTKDDKMVLYDRYDLWLVDPEAGNPPVNLTSGMGRKQNLRFRYVKLDKEALWLPEKMLLSAFQLKNKKAGFYALNIHNRKPKKLRLDDFAYSKPLKAKNAPEVVWRKESFRVYPDLYVSNLTFSNARKISNANPQQKNYLWGSVQLVHWVTFNGDTMQGLLYKPGNFDPGKKYPMLVYFYERYSDRLHRYYAPRPIRSVINFSYYTSNGYVIFIPDIKYRVGWPGASAYDCVVSGTEAMCSRFPFIDRTRLGMQGQSWGGYQSAYLVTQTDLFRCAEAGAPVSNMTSAYGGIRWGSGMSREFQYEHTQSRIGGTLWDKLPLYMQNSPLFFVPRIHTPLLIMHNDKDNAVPWYQGVELFNAMRRLNKPVWMLVYNGQPHNLSRRADEKDLTRRFQQFFDYFLKGAPEPQWMKYGVPAVKKGRDFGFETEKDK